MIMRDITGAGLNVIKQFEGFSPPSTVAKLATLPSGMAT